MINNFFIIIFAFFTLVISLYFYKKAAGTLSIFQPNIVTIAFYLQIIFQIFGSLLISLGLAKNWWVLQADNYDKSIIISFYMTYLSFMILPLFIILFNNLLKFNPQKEYLQLYISKWEKINSHNNELINYFIIILSMIILTLLLIILFYLTPSIPLFELFKGASSEKLAIARINTTNIGVGIYIKNIISRWVSPFITLLVFSFFLIKKSFFYLFSFIYVFIINFLFLFYTLEKGPILWFLITLLLVYSIYKSKLYLKNIIIWGLIFLLIIIIMYSTIMGKDNLTKSFISFSNRIFLSQYAGTVLTFDYFPEKNEFIKGKSLIPFSNRLNLSNNTKFSLLIMKYYNPHGWEKGTAGYAATQYIAGGYANFGYMGILISVIIVAFWLSLMNFISFRARLHPVSISFIALMMINLPRLMNVGLSNFIYSPEIILLVFVSIIYLFLIRGDLIIRFQKKDDQIE